jgi:lipopolysaccharide exporter
MKQRTLFRSILTLGSGTMIAQVIAILISPVFSRLYTPSEMGVFAIFLLGGTILFALASGKYELGIVLSNHNKTAVKLVQLAINLSFYSSLLVLLVLACLYPYLGHWLKLAHEYVYLLLLVPLFSWLTTIFESLRLYAIRNKEFKIVSQSLITKAICTALFQVLFGLMDWGVKGLVWGVILALLCGNIRLFKNYFADTTFTKWQVGLNKFGYEIKKYKRFAIFSSPSIFLNALSSELPILFFQIYFAPNVNGWFAYTKRVLALPMTSAGNAIGDAFYQRSGELKNNPEVLTATTWKLYRILLLLGVLPIAILFFWGDDVFAFVFGEAWRTAGTYAGLLCIWTLSVFVTSPISNVIFVKEKHQSSFVFQTIVFLSRLSVLIVAGWWAWSDVTTVAVYGIVGAVLFFSFILYILHLLKIPLPKVIGFTTTVVGSVFLLCYLATIWIQ